jgi:hypothetical protein
VLTITSPTGKSGQIQQLVPWGAPDWIDDREIACSQNATLSDGQDHCRSGIRTAVLEISDHVRMIVVGIDIEYVECGDSFTTETPKVRIILHLDAVAPDGFGMLRQELLNVASIDRCPTVVPVEST